MTAPCSGGELPIMGVIALASRRDGLLFADQWGFALL